MVDQHPFFFEALTWVDNKTFLFQQHLKTICDLLLPPTQACLPFFEQFIGQQMVHLQDSILERLHHHTFFNMFFDGILEAIVPEFYCVPVWGKHLDYSSTNFFNLSIIFPNFHQIASNTTRITTSFNCRPPSMCVHTSHQTYEYPLTLHPWQEAHGDPWCSLRHFCCHSMKCLFPQGTKTTTYAFLKHTQFLPLTNWHYVHQRRNPHLS
jgi:hypothetical protein